MSTKHLAQLPQLFRSPFLRKVALGRYYNELAERLEIAGLQNLMCLSLSGIFEAVYRLLLRDYRCEYVFKNTLMQNWFLSRHSAERSFITDEFRVGNSRVDMALFSKKSVAFEIKTEFDSPTRLASQSESYMKVFDLIYLVTTENMLPRLNIPESVGIMILTNDGSFKTVRDSESHSLHTDLTMAFNCLRQSERVSIIEKISAPFMEVPNSEMYTECKKRFRNLLPFEAQGHLVREVRNRKYSEPAVKLMNESPIALKHAALTLRATQQDAKKINDELKQIPKKKQNNKGKNEDVFSISEGQAERTACA